jgi:hypothetical protein
MDQETMNLIERFRARHYVHDRDDVCGETFDRLFSDVQDRLRAEIGDESYPVFQLSNAVFLKTLTLKKALRMASSDAGAALYAEGLEWERARQADALIPFEAWRRK